MPKIRKFRELSHRQQNRRVLLQTKYENTSRENVIINNIKSYTHMECFNINSFNAKELSSDETNVTDIIDNTIDITNITNERHVELQDNVLQSAQDSILMGSTRSKGKNTLKEKLHTWAIENNITQRSLTALLHILKEEGHDELPVDARTLLKTPKETIIRECENGHYFHYGLELALRDKLKKCTNINDIHTVELNINIDGLPLAKSSQSQLWPILGQIYNIETDPFLIGAYHGYKKTCKCNRLFTRIL